MTERLALIALLALTACKKDGDSDPVDTDVTASSAPIRACDVTLRIEAPDGVTQVDVAGQWSDFDPQPMTDDDGDGVFERWLGELRPGTWGYKLLWDGAWETVPPDVYTTWNDGFENRALVVGDCERPELAVISGSANAEGTVEIELLFTRAADGALLDASSVIATVGDELATVEADPETGRITVRRDGLGPGKYSVRVYAADTEGRAPESGDAFLPLWVEPEPFVWQSGVLYYGFLDRFADGGDHGLGSIDGSQYGTDYLGGDLVGAREKLEEGWFDELGVRSIWLSPLNQNPDAAYVGSGGHYYTGYHGYWPTKAREVEDRLGTTEISGDQALRDFVDSAHAHGIRVVMDVVLNHVHEDHEYITSHPDWFGVEPCPCTTDAGPCNWDTNPLGCWFTTYLPDLDYRNQEIVDQTVDDVLWWIETYDIDGLRVDAAKHMDHVILRTLSMRLRDRYETAGGAPFYLVGETFVGQGGQGLIMDYVAPYELDGQFEFPLLYPIRTSIGQGGGFRGLASEVKASDAAYGEWVHEMSPFMGNHDVGRYATDIAGCSTWSLFGGCEDVLMAGSPSSMTDAEWNLVNRLSMSYAFVVTQPGVPLLYYGDEVGLAGAGDPDNRRLMPWGTRSLAQETLLARFRELGQLRTQIPALQTGERTELWVDDSLYVYARDNGGGDVAIVAMAMADRVQDVPIPTGLSLEGKTVSNALADTRSYTVSGGNMTVTLNAWEYVVLTP